MNEMEGLCMVRLAWAPPGFLYLSFSRFHMERKWETFGRQDRQIGLRRKFVFTVSLTFYLLVRWAQQIGRGSLLFLFPLFDDDTYWLVFAKMDEGQEPRKIGQEARSGQQMCCLCLRWAVCHSPQGRHTLFGLYWEALSEMFSLYWEQYTRWWNCVNVSILTLTRKRNRLNYANCNEIRCFLAKIRTPENW